MYVRDITNYATPSTNFEDRYTRAHCCYPDDNTTASHSVLSPAIPNDYNDHVRVQDDKRTISELRTLRTIWKLVLSYFVDPLPNIIDLLANGAQCITYCVDSCNTAVSTKKNRMYALRRMLYVVHNVWVSHGEYYVIVLITNLYKVFIG